MGAPAVPPLCRETQSLGQQMLNATVGINGSIRPPVCREMSFSRTAVRVIVAAQTVHRKEIYFCFLSNLTECDCLVSEKVLFFVFEK